MGGGSKVMEFRIFRKTFSLHEEFLIYKSGKELYRAKQEGFFLKNFRVLSGKRHVISLFQNLTVYVSRYTFYIQEERPEFARGFKIESKGILKKHFQCYFLENKYDLYIHTALAYSIFKNDIQIAEIKKTEIDSFGENEYTAKCNSDVDDYIMTVFLILINYKGFYKFSFLYGLINISLGGVFETKKINKEWKPQ